MNGCGRGGRSFALVSTLLIVAVMALGALAFFQTARMDRLVTRNTADRIRAELAAESGQAAAAALLRLATTNDHFIIVLNPTNRQLFAGNGSNQAAGAFAYQPLWSYSSNLAALNSNLVTNGLPTWSTAAANVTNIVLSLPGGGSATSPALAWVGVTNSTGQTNARFAFWLEDLSGRLDLSVAGSTGTNAARPTGSNPAELAVWSLFNPGTRLDSNNATVQSLVNARSALLTPATARLADANVTTNHLADLATGLIHDTNEPELVPYGFGYASNGQAKLNLNQAITNATALDLIAGQINNNLPTFNTRAGGMNGSAYIYALAANIIDYADANDSATTNNIGGINIVGFDNYPMPTHIYDAITYTRGANARLDIVTYIQLWNPANTSATNVANGALIYSFNQQIAYVSTNAGNPIILTNLTSSPLANSNFTVTNSFSSNSVYIASITNTISLADTARFPGFPINTNSITISNASGTHNNFSLAIANTTIRPAIGFYAAPNSLTSGQTNLTGTVLGLQQNSPLINLWVADPRMLSYRGFGLPVSYADIPYTNVFWGGYPGRTNPLVSGTPGNWPDGTNTIGSTPSSLGTIFPAGTAPTSGFFSIPDPAPCKLSTNGSFISVMELGNLFDPVQWAPPAATTNYANCNINTNSGTVWTANNMYGGGATLRIGRPEHSRFTNNGTRASQLLDLFAVGTRTANGGATVLNSVAGRINLNTATTNTLRALAAGVLHTNDPNLLSGGTAAGSTFVIPTNAVASFVFGVTNFRAAAPFVAPSQLTLITRGGNFVFGNASSGTIMGSANLPLVWNDAAAEEWFSKVYPLCTVRSRNFIVYVVAQALATNSGRPIASVTRAYQVYAEPLRDPASGLTTNVAVRTLRSWPF